MAAHAGLLKAMGCSVIIIAEVTGCVHGDRRRRFSERPTIDASHWIEFGRRLTAVARAAADYDLRLCYHHHMGTIVESGADIDALMDSTGDQVSLLLDTGHAVFAGADPVALARTYAARIGHLHCKDIRTQVMQARRNRDSSFLDAVLDGVFTVPGDGSIDFPSVFAPLAEAGYTGWVVVEAEQDPVVANPRRYARLGFDYLANQLRTLALNDTPKRFENAVCRGVNRAAVDERLRIGHTVVRPAAALLNKQCASRKVPGIHVWFEVSD